jgi:hypothetical protein
LLSRLDDRGIEVLLKGNKNDTEANFATDIEVATTFLANKGFSGLLGSEEGGMIAPMVTVEQPKEVKFLVLMYSPGNNSYYRIIMQQKLYGRKICPI